MNVPALLNPSIPHPAPVNIYIARTPGLSFVEHVQLKNSRLELRFESCEKKRSESRAIIEKLQLKHEQYMAAAEKQKIEKTSQGSKARGVGMATPYSVVGTIQNPKPGYYYDLYGALHKQSPSYGSLTGRGEGARKTSAFIRGQKYRVLQEEAWVPRKGRLDVGTMSVVTTDRGSSSRKKIRMMMMEDIESGSAERECRSTDGKWF